MDPRLRLYATMGLLGAGLVLGVKFLLPLTAPFFIGLVLACIFEPVVRFCENRCRMPRWLVSGGVLVLVLAAAGAFLFLIAIQAWLGLRALIISAMRADGSFQAYLRAGGRILAGLPEPLRHGAGIVLESLPGQLGKVWQALLAGLGHLPAWLLFLFLGVVAAYFFSRDHRLLAGFLFRLAPREWRARAGAMKEEIVRALFGFLRAQIALLALTLAIGWAGLALLGVANPLLWGLVLAVLDLLPMIGPGAVLLPWAGVSLALGGWTRGLGLIAIFAVLAVAHEAAEARILGGSLGLHPLAAMASVYMGLRLFGAGGLVCGPLLLVLLRAFYRALALPGGEGGRAVIKGRETDREGYRHPGLDRLDRTSGA
ncbi:MAG: AI-2E family transporter [Patescibacteria group bacterium]